MMNINEYVRYFVFLLEIKKQKRKTKTKKDVAK